MNARKILYNFRRDFKQGSFDVSNAKKDPLEQFSDWFDDAVKSNFLDPNAMSLATATKDGKPSSRFVLLKKFDDDGYVFYTNYDSRKGKEISENPYGALLFYWDKLERQVRIEGKIEKISREESEEYFKTRDYVSRLGAWASKQSEELSSRFSLMRAVAKLAAKYPKNPPLPPNWGGYRLTPDYYEFWQGRKSRLHDRIAYQKRGDVWIIKRLYP